MRTAAAEGLFDASVLVAVCYGEHQHHDASMKAFLKFNFSDAACAAHSRAEVYASLFLETLQERLTIVALDAAEYINGIQYLAAVGIIGGTIYDGILALCALNVNAETIYTWNLRHFHQFGSEVKGRLSTP